MSFGDEGCKHIAKMRAENLENIGLCNSNIGPDGFYALTEAKWTKIS